MDSAEFHQPIVSPFELEIACTQSKEWTGDYETDFCRLLPGISASLAHEDEPKKKGEDEESEETSFSLITGSYRPDRSRANGKVLMITISLCLQDDE